MLEEYRRWKCGPVPVENWKDADKVDIKLANCKKASERASLLMVVIQLKFAAKPRSNLLTFYASDSGFASGSLWISDFMNSLRAIVA